MRTVKVRLTHEQYELIAQIAEQEGEEFEEVIPNLIDEYVELVRRMEALGLLLDTGQVPET